MDLNTGEGDVARITFTYFNDNFDQPTLTYLQASRNTFIELMPAGANRSAGFTHFGVHVDDDLNPSDTVTDFEALWQ